MVIATLSFPDVYTENPDEKSIITYVVAFYHYFSKMKALAVEGKRVGKVRVREKCDILIVRQCNLKCLVSPSLPNYFLLVKSVYDQVAHRHYLSLRINHFIHPCLLQVLDHAIETEKMIEKYDTLASDLLIWIEQTIIVLNNRKLANSLSGVQQQLQAFNTYRTVEKPPK